MKLVPQSARLARQSMVLHQLARFFRFIGARRTAGALFEGSSRVHKAAELEARYELALATEEKGPGETEKFVMGCGDLLSRFEELVPREEPKLADDEELAGMYSSLDTTELRRHAHAVIGALVARSHSFTCVGEVKLEERVYRIYRGR